jgi:hypothetical protein
MFESDSADTHAGKFRLVLMGSRAEGLLCADPGARTHIGASGICIGIYPLVVVWGTVVQNPRRGCPRVSNKINIRIPIKNKNWGDPIPPALWLFWAEKGGNFKSCPRVSRLGMRP